MLNSLSLNGTWTVHFTDGTRGNSRSARQAEVEPSRTLPASVPGEIHLDLMKAGLIPDIYRGLGHLTCAWTENYLWTYRRTFTVPAEALRSAGVWLVLEGVEMFADVCLNGEQVGTHGNAFYPCRINVTGKLRTGENLVTVRCDPGLWGVADRKSEGLSRNEDEPLHKRYWTRRIQSQTSWDWSPRVMNCGIQGGARIEYLSDGETLRVDQFAPLAELSEDLQTGSIRARVFVENVGSAPVQTKATVEVAGVRAERELTIGPGQSVHELTLTVPHPQLWYPAGHGAQPLYDVAVTLGGEKTSKRVGFRHVRVRREKPQHGEPGETFVFEINRKMIFCKGGNFVPCDLLGAAMTQDRYRTLLDMAQEANFNFLRVWGGGQYESDFFYDECDRRGITVWQDFIFACMKYPVHDQGFYDDVMVEARYNVRRLAPHPSLIAWCGNNELETALWNWGPYDKGHVMPDYGLFHYALPRMLGTEDPGRHYQPSSPFSFHPHVNPDDPTRGDQHPWSIGFLDFDHRKYRTFVSRFPNEGGSLGPTSLGTMRDCLAGSDGKIRNFHWLQHDNAIDGWREPSVLDTITEQWLGVKLTDLTLEQYTYVGGLIQGEALREYIDNYRRRMFNSSSAVFWMFNDVWPAVRSWTIVDWNLRRTPSFHPVRRACTPVSVVVAEADTGADFLVYGVSELDTPLDATLRFGVFTTAGDYLHDETRPVVLSPNASVPVAVIPRSVMTDPTRQVAFACLEKDGKVLARNKLILPMWRELALTAAKIEARPSPGSTTFLSPQFALGVCIDLEGDASPADNFFDLYPNQPYTVATPGAKVIYSAIDFVRS
jgi:beta-mannosidase